LIVAQRLRKGFRRLQDAREAREGSKMLRGGFQALGGSRASRIL